MSQADWDRLQYYSRKVKLFAGTKSLTGDAKIHPSTYIRIAQLQSSPLFPSLRHLYYNLVSLDESIYKSISHIFLFLSPLLDSLELYNIKGFENTIIGPFLATLSSKTLSRIILDTGRMSADILKKSIVHFKQLRSLVLRDAVFMSDFSLWEVLGTLPSLAKLTLTAIDPASHPMHVPENSNSQSEGPKYFEALKSLSVTGSFFLIQHLLSFIDSPYLKSIRLYPVIKHVRFNHDHEPEDLLTPSMSMVASKWSQSLKEFELTTNDSCVLSHDPHNYPISKCLTLLTDLHEMQTFYLYGWRMENMDCDVRRLVTSWLKLETLWLPLDDTFISLSTLRIIAENCPKLRRLQVRLDASNIPLFDTSSKSLHHNLEVLNVPFTSSSQTTLGSQIQTTRYLDFIFPNLSIITRPNDVHWSGIRDLLKLCQDARRVK